MGERAQQAEAYFAEGYNCAQAVMAAFYEGVGLDKDTAMLLTSSFGGGFARMREVCGAVSAMFMVVGLKSGFTSPTDQEAKLAHYQDLQALAGRFKEQAGSLLCRDLLDGDPHAQPDPASGKMSCQQLVGLAARLTEEALGEPATVSPA